MSIDMLWVIVSTAKMPSTCWGAYRKIAVMNALSGQEGPPRYVRDTKDWRIIEVWDRMYCGHTAECAAAVAFAEACELAKELAATLQCEWKVRPGDEKKIVW